MQSPHGSLYFLYCGLLYVALGVSVSQTFKAPLLESLLPDELAVCQRLQDDAKYVFATAGADELRSCLLKASGGRWPLPVCESHAPETAAATAEHCSRALHQCYSGTEQEKVETLRFELYYFAAFVGRQAVNASATRWLLDYGRTRRNMPGGRPPLSDRRNASGCSRTIRAVRHVDRLYDGHGIAVVPCDMFVPVYVQSGRFTIVLQTAEEKSGCAAWRAQGEPASRDSPVLGKLDSQICKCFVESNVLGTGIGLLDADVELFVNLIPLLQKPTRVFVIGNAFGYSTILLGHLVKEGGGSVDVIDAESEGDCNRAGSWLTRKVAKQDNLDIQLMAGLSPKGVPDAARSKEYELAFIDGLHTVDQLVLDFEAVEPLMSKRAVIVCHDVGFAGMEAAFDRIPLVWRRHWVRGRKYKNLAGTVLLHRGYTPDFFDTF
eukprot:TRINITY_DN17851_c0_g1_i11.p1 TRINITY_DN17851_c0_g1~~TRINITY_DN17851_c0_g1_i11.p1  ORF type:complete len:434 (-),score=46.42 TRINITY_DN17851_c0_g1_i11:778-2079(-)